MPGYYELEKATILQIPSQKDPIKRAEWIKKFSHHLRGKKKSEENRRRMSETPRHVSDENRRKISKTHLGIPLSEELLRRVSKGQRGKMLSEEHTRKMSKRQKKHPSEESLRKKSDTVQNRFFICVWHRTAGVRILLPVSGFALQRLYPRCG